MDMYECMVVGVMEDLKGGQSEMWKSTGLITNGEETNGLMD